MHKLTIPTILITTVLIAGIFAFMPIDKATTVHTTIQGTQFNEVKVVFVDNTSVSNATAGCGSGNQGIAFWTISNTTLANEGGTLGSMPTSTFTIDNDGVTTDTDGHTVILSQNQTAVSGVTAFDGTGTDPEVIIGVESSGSSSNIGDISLSVLCRSGGTADATTAAVT